MTQPIENLTISYYDPDGVFHGGDRVELHPGTDAWMQGDRYGTVVDTLETGYVTVRMDKSSRILRCPPELLRNLPL